MIQDPISDMLTRIRNAQLAKHERVSVSNTKMNKRISHVLKKQGYIESFNVSTHSEKELELSLKYVTTKKSKPCITNLKRLSSPGLRLYSNYKEIPPVLNGMGVMILSTSKGVMTDREARANKVGGELLCSIW
uniref:ribosomal protein S8 n=1 Tax=Gayralia brasiliensis TaxID=1286870 RepID=UPI002410DB38|nr:ribosomal protein S8 [Gayralia brasiliensis]YP_010733777.1 ribosomal protein S8 [Monostroma nitidum]WEG92974.1 ribosomal protein S8 [Gayralia brasiliensis]WEG93048.1 ribosomal protein S8 [Monostroma nitidum]